MSESTPWAVPTRSAYGDSVFVRSLSICSPAPGSVSLTMNDTAHDFRIDFTHEGGKVASVKAAWNLYPLSSCAEATQSLQAMVGSRLSDCHFAIARQSEPKQHCTHMYDMFCLAATHAHEQRPDYRYEVVVPDSVDGPLLATLTRNGDKQLMMELENYRTIVQPAPCRGRSVLKGFMPWVKANVPEDQHVHYFIMQKALFVALTQKFDFESTLGKSARLSGPPDGSCYGSQPERYHAALRVSVPRSISRETANPV